MLKQVTPDDFDESEDENGYQAKQPVRNKAGQEKTQAGLTENQNTSKADSVAPAVVNSESFKPGAETAVINSESGPELDPKARKSQSQTPVSSVVGDTPLKISKIDKEKTKDPTVTTLDLATRTGENSGITKISGEDNLSLTLRINESGAGSDVRNTVLNERFHRIFRHLGVVPTLKDPLILGVTSSVRGEGRTITALGLAMSIVQQFPVPVLLVEADLENPTLANDLGLDNQGLSEYLRGQSELDDLIMSAAIPDLSLILAGNCESQPIRLLRSERLSNLLSILRQQFAAIIIDMPPLSMTAESSRLITEVDHVLLVVEAGTTPAKLVKSSLELVPEDKRAGVLLNRTTKPLGPFQWLLNLFKKDS